MKSKEMRVVAPGQNDVPKEVTCMSEGVYSGSLRYSHMYRVIAYDTDKRQMKVQNENGHVRWYPENCFVPGRKEFPKLARILAWDQIEDAQRSSVEVTIELSDGQRRWCFFITPEGLAHLDGQTLHGTVHLILYGAPHMIVLRDLSLQSIEEALSYIECQGELLACTRLIEQTDVS